ncbi:hypothetical protein XI05_09640 [Bradyrhizobium sp. CCBAU 11357]|nr:hypothetical protein [Bradyrhizobium sp. CCBAU 11357]
MLGLDVADDGLDSRTTLHLAPDGSRDAADLARDPDPEPVRVVVAAVPFVDMDAPSLHAVSFSMSATTGPSVCPSKGLPCSALAWSTNCPPFGDVTGVAILTLQPNS